MISQLKRNIIASYVSQIYVALSGFVLVPVYIKYMGVEAYGLVGFFSMLQAWFLLLDMGLTPTMAREAARFRGGAIDAASLRALCRSLERLFLLSGFIGALAFTAASGYIVHHWLHVERLSLRDVQISVILMGLIVALRWITELYRGVITGFEHLVWLGAFNVAIATFRFVIVLLFFHYFGSGPVQFFSYQLVLGCIELAVLSMMSYRLLPKVEQTATVLARPLRAVLGFSTSLAFASVVWVVVTQSDKLILSKLLPLTDYAYFTLAVLLASGVMVISNPIGSALLPRMVRLHASGEEATLLELYRNATQVTTVIAIPIAIVLALFSGQVIWAWTGSTTIAQHSAPVLTLYALGNGVLAWTVFPYFLQFAKGNLKLHVAGSLLYAVSLIPLLVWATIRYGVIGAGYSWLFSNLIYFLVWPPMVHRRFLKGVHARWLAQDVGLIAAATAACGFLTKFVVKLPTSRFSSATSLICICLVLMLVAAIASSCVRGMVTQRVRQLAEGGIA